VEGEKREKGILIMCLERWVCCVKKKEKKDHALLLGFRASRREEGEIEMRSVSSSAAARKRRRNRKRACWVSGGVLVGGGGGVGGVFLGGGFLGFLGGGGVSFFFFWTWQEYLEKGEGKNCPTARPSVVPDSLWDQRKKKRKKRGCRLRHFRCATEKGGPQSLSKEGEKERGGEGLGMGFVASRNSPRKRWIKSSRGKEKKKNAPSPVKRGEKSEPSHVRQCQAGEKKKREVPLRVTRPRMAGQRKRGRGTKKAFR